MSTIKPKNDFTKFVWMKSGIQTHNHLGRKRALNHSTSTLTRLVLLTVSFAPVAVTSFSFTVFIMNYEHVFDVFVTAFTIV